MAASASSTSGTHVWLVLMKAYRSLARHAERSIDAFDLGLSEFATLELLLNKGPQNVSEIGRRVGLTSGSITTAIDRLEERKLVVRGPHPTDRRARVVRLTPKGTAEIGRAFEQHEAAMNAAAEGLSNVERATLRQLLKKLGQTADQRFASQEDDS